MNLSGTSLSDRSITPSRSYALHRRCFGISSRTSLSSQRSHEEYHHARLGEYAASLWKENSMTDVMVVVQAKEFHAHKAVLACYSPYFKEVLLKPGCNNVHYLEIPCVTPTAFEILLSYMYTGEIKVTCQNLAEVYRAARRLGMKDALKKCRDLLNVTPQSIENTIYLYVTAKKMDLLDASVRAFKLMLTHFETLVSTKQFLELDAEQIVDFFSSDVLATRSEVNVYLAALNWINNDFLEREACIDQVMACVRFPLMNLTEILLCHHPPLLPGIVLYPKVREALFNATCYVAAKHMGQESLFQELSCKPRTYLLEEQPPILWDSECLYDPVLYPQYRDDRAATKIQASYRGYITRKRVDEEYKKRFVAAVIIQAAFRGYLVRRKLRNQRGYHKQMKERESKPFYPGGRYTYWDEPSKDSMHISNAYPSAEKKAAVISDETGSSLVGSDVLLFPRPNESNISDLSQECRKNVVYAITGFEIEDDCTRTNTLLCYSPKANMWKDIGALPEPRFDARLALLDGFLYCIGGCSPAQRSETMMLPKRECFKYHVSHREWVDMAPLKFCRMFHGVAVLNGIIYAIGGKDHKSRILSSVERYDTSLNRWSESAPMGTPRMGMGVTAHDEMIWVVGGMTGQGNKLFLLDIVECFDSKTGRWERKVKLPHPIAFLALVECRNKLYSIGGAFQESLDRRELISVNEVYIYDETNNCWRMTVSLPSPLHSVVASSLGGDIYVLGGHSAQKFGWLQEVFYYDSSLRRWRPCCQLQPSAADRIIAAVGYDSNE